MPTSGIINFLEQLVICCNPAAYGRFNVRTGKGYTTVREPITSEVIGAHAANTQPILSYPLVGDQTRVGVLDLDNHDKSLTWEQMEEAAGPMVDSLRADGFHPMLVRSGSGSGIHVWIFCSQFKPARSMRRYLAALARRHGFKPGAGGVAKCEVEVFPKQDGVEGDELGSGIALPFARSSLPLSDEFEPLDLTSWRPPPLNTLFSSGEVLAEYSGAPEQKLLPRIYSVLEGDLEEATAALKTVPSDSRDVWITVGHVMKFTFGEAGFTAWCDWSTKSENAASPDELRKRWNGFKPRGHVNLGTVFHLGQQHGWNGPSHPIVRKFNARYGILTRGRLTLIIDKLARTESDELLVTLGKATFLDRYAAYRMPSPVSSKKGAPLTEAQFWLQHELADHYTEVIFDPSRPPGRCGTAYNVWQGFAYDPFPGDWSMFQEHLRENISNGDERLYRWLVNWMAWVVQNPGKPPGTAAVLQGAPGTGKTVVGGHFGAVWKPHAIELTHQHHVSGHFNAFVFGRKFIFIDEGTYGGDKVSAGALKTRITEPYIIMEAKGVDAIKVPNRAAYMIASNNDSVVAADLGDRRWMVFRVGDGRKEDHAFFAAMEEQMRAGGYQAMLYDLQHHNWSVGPDPRRVIHTAALFDQVKRNLSPELRYIHLFLDRAQLPEAGLTRQNRVTIQELFNDMRNLVPNANYATSETLGRTLTKALGGAFTKRLAGRYQENPDAPERTTTVRTTEYTFAPLADCRARFERHVGMPIDWSADTPDWLPGDAIM